MPTVIFADSFDHYATADILKKWSSSSNIGDQAIMGAVGRNSTQGLRCNHVSALYKSLGASYPKLYVEAAFRCPTMQNGPQGLIYLMDSNGAVHMDVRITNAGSIQVTRANGTVLATSVTGLITQDAWNHIGFYSLIHSTTGAYEVRLNGTSIAALTASNANTRNGANGDIGTVALSSSFASNWTYFDDLIVCTDAFCGDCRVKACPPDGAGNYSEWPVPTSGYAYPGGSGNRPTITVTQPASNQMFNGTPASVVDGNTAAGMGTNFSTLASGPYLRFDFTTARTITEAAVWYGSNADFGVLKWQGSNDASAWTDLGATFAMSAGSNIRLVVPLSNSTAYRYYQMVGVSGGGYSLGQLYEVDFSIDSAGASYSAYQMVDETLLNGDTDFVSSNTAGQRSIYNFASVGITGNVKAVQHVVTMRKDDAGSRTIAHMARSGGTDSEGTAMGVTDSYMMLRRVLSVNPATSNPWNSAEVDAAQFGTKLVS